MGKSMAKRTHSGFGVDVLLISGRLGIIVIAVESAAHREKVGKSYLFLAGIEILVGRHGWRKQVDDPRINTGNQIFA